MAQILSTGEGLPAMLHLTFSLVKRLQQMQEILLEQCQIEPAMLPGSSISGTTLRLRPQAGYYDGSTGNSVQLSNANFIATNIKSGVNLFGIIGTMPVKPDDYRGSPGGQFLTHGDMINGGYFGRYTGIVSGNGLASACGITIGVSQFYLNDSIDWVKFGYEDKILFIARKPIRRAISWDDLNAKSCVFGQKQVTFDGITYKCRLMRQRNSDPGTGSGRDMILLSRVRQSSWDNQLSQ